MRRIPTADVIVSQTMSSNCRDIQWASGGVERSEQCVYLLQGQAERLASR
jgi:hypothetical protein